MVLAVFIYWSSFAIRASGVFLCIQKQGSTVSDRNNLLWIWNGRNKFSKMSEKCVGTTNTQYHFQRFSLGLRNYLFLMFSVFLKLKKFSTAFLLLYLTGKKYWREKFLLPFLVCLFQYCIYIFFQNIQVQISLNPLLLSLSKKKSWEKLLKSDFFPLPEGNAKYKFGFKFSIHV